MPKTGYKSITIPNKLKNKLEKLAHKKGQTIPKLIEQLTNQAITKEKQTQPPEA